MVHCTFLSPHHSRSHFKTAPLPLLLTNLVLLLYCLPLPCYTQATMVLYYEWVVCSSLCLCPLSLSFSLSIYLYVLCWDFSSLACGMWHQQWLLQALYSLRTQHTHAKTKHGTDWWRRRGRRRRKEAPLSILGRATKRTPSPMQTGRHRLSRHFCLSALLACGTDSSLCFRLFSWNCHLCGFLFLSDRP